MISKLECIYYAQIALINIIQKEKTIEPFMLYKEMTKLLGIKN